MNLREELDKLDGGYGESTSVDIYLEIIRKWALEMVGEDDDNRPEITKWLISKDYTKGFNDRGKEVRTRIEENIK